MNEHIEELLEAIAGSQPHHGSVDQNPDALRNRYRVFTKRHSFEPGQLVSWKPGMSNRRCPPYGQPVIVMQALDVPVMAQESNAGRGSFREPLDLIVGIIDSDGDFEEMYVDSRRMQPWTN